MRPNASGTTRANTSLTIGSLNDRKIFVTRSSAGSITCGTIHKRSKAYFVLFFNSHVELLMRAYIALTIVGMYGVLAYSVAQRTREIGVRMALGAQSRDVMQMLLRKALVLMAMGIILGG